jgi:hypothetical protein
MAENQIEAKFLALRILALAIIIAAVVIITLTTLRPAKREAPTQKRSQQVAIPTTKPKPVEQTQQEIGLPKPPDIFFMGEPGQSGCYVCHGDPKLVKLYGGKLKSFFIDKRKMDAGPHKDIACTACHRDFGNTNHVVKSADWRIAASLSCIRCHTHQKQYTEYAKGKHGQLALAGKLGRDNRRAATCGDCHGGHDITALKNNPLGRKRLRAKAFKVCGSCHQDYWQSYADYYHGRAYKTGASDAPPCWDCHGYHDVKPSSDSNSLVAVKNLPTTCSKCHEGADEIFVQYANLIHGKERELETNVALQLISNAVNTATNIYNSLVQRLKAYLPGGR